ncbi:MAG TPA: NAD(P)/FAD-dependent oxidoreductase [Candidatus Krumholzibacteria bacterium]
MPTTTIPAYDVIVIGAGHNGLATAAILAKAGRKVVVLERRDVTGGMCAGEEFHPGYRTDGLLHDTAQLRPGLVEALELSRHGLETGPVAPVLVPEADGPGVVLSADAAATEKELARLGDGEVRGWRAYRGFIADARRVIEPLLNEIPPDVTRLGTMDSGSLPTLLRSGMALRKLGREKITGLLRVPPMCVADWLNEFFAGDLLKGALAHAAISATWAGPWSPGTAANLLLLECSATGSVRGGASAVAVALEKSARAAGVEIRTGAEVRSLVLERGAATGVVLASGETLRAGRIAASCDPRTLFLELIARGTLPVMLERRMGLIRGRGTTAKVHLALTRRLEFASRPGARIERARTSGSLDDLERAFDAVKYRRMSERPLLDIHVPTVARPDLAPGDGDVVSILVHFAPHDLEGGWTPDARERLGDAVVDELCRVAPGARDAIAGREVLTPADIAQRYRVAGGHIHHVEHSLDQLVIRPTLESMRYATPVANLFLCGSGAHPGGGLSGAPGALCAAAILQRR